MLTMEIPYSITQKLLSHTQTHTHENHTEIATLSTKSWWFKGVRAVPWLRFDLWLLRSQFGNIESKYEVRNWSKPDKRTHFFSYFFFLFGFSWPSLFYSPSESLFWLKKIPCRRHKSTIQLRFRNEVILSHSNWTIVPQEKPNQNEQCHIWLSWFLRTKISTIFYRLAWLHHFDDVFDELREIFFSGGAISFEL